MKHNRSSIIVVLLVLGSWCSAGLGVPLGIVTTSSTTYLTSPSTAIYPVFVDGMPYQAWTYAGSTNYFQLKAEGGASSYYTEWSLVSGNLPTGLTMDIDGKISGTPAAEGTFNFRVRVTDFFNATAEKDLTIIANPYRAKWFRDAKFGFMIQWGAFSYPQTLSKEAIPLFEARITQFNAETWAQEMYNRGGRVLNFTVMGGDNIRHWPSTSPSVYEYKTTRDIVGELITACHARGIKVLGYLPGGGGWGGMYDVSTIDNTSATLHEGLVAELIAKGIDGFWFDVGGSIGVTEYLNWSRMIPLIRTLNPYVTIESNPGIGGWGYILQYPNTDIVNYEGPQSDLESTLVVPVPNTNKKKMAIDVDNMLEYSWTWSVDSPRSVKSALAIQNSISQCWRMGGTYMLNFTPHTDGTFIVPGEKAVLDAVATWVNANLTRSNAPPDVYDYTTGTSSAPLSLLTSNLSPGTPKAGDPDHEIYVGMLITIGRQNLIVNAIGRYYIEGNNKTHKLKIIRVRDKKLICYTGIDMAAGTADALGFKYKKIAPVTLEAGKAYYVISQEDSSDLRWNGTLPDPAAISGGLLAGPIWTDDSGTRYYNSMADMSSFPIMSGSSDNANGQLLNLKSTGGTIVQSSNLALGAIARLEDNYGNPSPACMGTLYGCNAVDADLSTIAEAGDNWAWTLWVDLGSLKTGINHVVINFGQGCYATEYEVLGSADNATWTQVAYVPDSTNVVQDIRFGPQNFRYFRIRSWKPDGPGQTGAQMAIAELEIYASAISGDANGDAKVDVSDLGILAANYDVNSGATWPTGDFNGDGKVDVSDLGILSANYGTGTGTNADFAADFEKVFGASPTAEEKTETATATPIGCTGLGIPLIAGILLLGLLKPLSQ